MNYEDIIHLPHPTSKRHQRMPLSDRAAQFAPFAALTGHAAAINETVRQTEAKRELHAQKRWNLNEKLRFLIELGADADVVELTYFIPDERKAGGRYERTEGYIKRLDEHKNVLVLTDRSEIPLENIYEIQSPSLPLELTGNIP